jgi:uncharacterized protein YabN with tetrapyrrole methylase and pyrophosphatase domain
MQPQRTACVACRRSEVSSIGRDERYVTQRDVHTGIWNRFVRRLPQKNIMRIISAQYERSDDVITVYDVLRDSASSKLLVCILLLFLHRHSGPKS